MAAELAGNARHDRHLEAGKAKGNRVKEGSRAKVQRFLRFYRVVGGKALKVNTADIRAQEAILGP